MAKRKRKSKDATEEADAGELRVRQYLLTVPVLHDNPITQDDLQAMVSECILDRLKARLPQLESQPEPESLAPAQERITRPFEPGDIEQALRLQPAQECPSAREPEKELPPWQPDPGALDPVQPYRKAQDEAPSLHRRKNPDC